MENFSAKDIMNKFLEGEKIIKAVNEAALVASVPPKHVINPVSWTYERLLKYFSNFEKGLNDEQEIGAKLVSFGQTISIYIDTISFHGPDMLIFYGKTADGENVTLIQHHSQLNILLVALKKIHDKPKRIGFTAKNDESSKE